MPLELDLLFELMCLCMQLARTVLLLFCQLVVKDQLLHLPAF